MHTHLTVLVMSPALLHTTHMVAVSSFFKRTIGFTCGDGFRVFPSGNL